MFATIVWATDGSELADRALPYVKELARVHRARIVAVHANELVGRFAGQPLLPDEPDQHRKVERQVTELRGEGFEAMLVVESGSAEVPTLIARAARDAGADLVVVGTHGHGGFKAAVLGSVARGLLHEAHCPVLAIPPDRETVAAAQARDTTAGD